MKRIRFAFALILTLCVLGCPGPVAAQDAGTIEINLGYAKTWTDWAGREPLGGGPAVGIAYWRAASADLSWGLEGAFQDLGELDYSFVDPYTLTPGREKLEANVLRVNPAFRVRIGRPNGPNFLAQVGAGLYHVAWKAHLELGFITDFDDSDNEFGFNAGAGVSLPLGETKRLNVLGIYHVVGGDNAFAEDYNHAEGRVALGIGL